MPAPIKCALCDAFDVHDCPGGVVHNGAPRSPDTFVEIFGPLANRQAKHHNAQDHQVCNEGFLHRVRPPLSDLPRERQ